MNGRTIPETCGVFTKDPFWAVSVGDPPNVSAQAQVIERNDTMKRCIFEAFDAACDRHRLRFMQILGSATAVHFTQ